MSTTTTTTTTTTTASDLVVPGEEKLFGFLPAMNEKLIPSKDYMGMLFYKNWKAKHKK